MHTRTLNNTEWGGGGVQVTVMDLTSIMYLFI